MWAFVALLAELATDALFIRRPDIETIHQRRALSAALGGAAAVGALLLLFV